MSVPSMAIAPVAHLATAEHFAEPSHQLGISIDMDLHTYQQTQHPGPNPGTLWIDGTVYSTALPERLRHIAAPALTQTAVEKAPCGTCLTNADRTRCDRSPPHRGCAAAAWSGPARQAPLPQRPQKHACPAKHPADRLHQESALRLRAHRHRALRRPSA